MLPSSPTGGSHLGKPGSKLEAFQSQFHKPVSVNPGHPVRRPNRSLRGVHPATPKDNHADGDHDHRDNDPDPGPPAAPNRAAAPGASSSQDSGVMSRSPTPGAVTTAFGVLAHIQSDNVRSTSHSGPFAVGGSTSACDPGCVKTNFEVQRRKINSRSLRSQQ